jgi:hypothetical protein
MTGSRTPYNQMLAQSATIRLDPPLAPMSGVVAEIRDALRRLEEGSP